MIVRVVQLLSFWSKVMLWHVLEHTQSVNGWTGKQYSNTVPTESAGIHTTATSSVLFFCARCFWRCSKQLAGLPELHMMLG